MHMFFYSHILCICRDPHHDTSPYQGVERPPLLGGGYSIYRNMVIKSSHQSTIVFRFVIYITIAFRFVIILCDLPTEVPLPLELRTDPCSPFFRVPFGGWMVQVQSLHEGSERGARPDNTRK